MKPQAKSAPEYPDLREHLFTRRDLLTFVGASMVTGALSACIQGKPADPNYRTFRLPGDGELQTPLASGETCRFYVNGNYYDDEPVEDLAQPEQAAVDCLSDFTASELAAVGGLRTANQALDQILAPYFPGFSGAVITVLAPALDEL